MSEKADDEIELPPLPPGSYVMSMKTEFPPGCGVIVEDVPIKFQNVIPIGRKTGMSMNTATLVAGTLLKRGEHDPE